MKWRRTNILSADGSIRDDDWTLYADDGRNLARIYQVSHGPREGQWFWAVQIDTQGRPWNGGTGTEATGREAREACKARIPGILRSFG